PSTKVNYFPPDDKESRTERRLVISIFHWPVLMGHKDMVHQFLYRRHGPDPDPVEQGRNLLFVLHRDKDFLHPGLFGPINLLKDAADLFHLALDRNLASYRDILADRPLKEATDDC